MATAVNTHVRKSHLSGQILGLQSQCGLSTRPSLLGFNECMVWHNDCGPFVVP